MRGICRAIAVSTKLSYAGKYERLGEAVRVTHTRVEVPDLLKHGSLHGSEVQGAYHLEAGRSWQQCCLIWQYYVENLRAVFSDAIRRIRGRLSFCWEYAHPGRF